MFINLTSNLTDDDDDLIKWYWTDTGADDPDDGRVWCTHRHCGRGDIKWIIWMLDAIIILTLKPDDYLSYSLVF